MTPLQFTLQIIIFAFIVALLAGLTAVIAFKCIKIVVEFSASSQANLVDAVKNMQMEQAAMIESVVRQTTHTIGGISDGVFGLSAPIGQDVAANSPNPHQESEDVGKLDDRDPYDSLFPVFNRDLVAGIAPGQGIPGISFLDDSLNGDNHPNDRVNLAGESFPDEFEDGGIEVG